MASDFIRSDCTDLAKQLRIILYDGGIAFQTPDGVNRAVIGLDGVIRCAGMLMQDNAPSASSNTAAPAPAPSTPAPAPAASAPAPAPTPSGTSVAPPAWTVIRNPNTSVQVSSSAPAGVPLDIGAGRTYIFDCIPDHVLSFSVVFASSVFTGGGASINTNQVVDFANRRNMWFSDTPGGLPPLDLAGGGNKDRDAQSSSEDVNIYVVFDKPTSGCVHIPKDTPVWLNVRPTSHGEKIRFTLAPFPQA
jgi:hypothetical protein